VSCKDQEELYGESIFLGYPEGLYSLCNLLIAAMPAVSVKIFG
jgi:hypothetical protein